MEFNDRDTIDGSICDTPNCNDCIHISITEEEQHKTGNKYQHICEEYCKRVYHWNTHIGHMDCYIHPCEECKKNLHKEFKNTHFRRT